MYCNSNHYKEKYHLIKKKILNPNNFIIIYILHLFNQDNPRYFYDTLYGANQLGSH